MHSLRPCLILFVIAFALCVGATQSAEGYNEGLEAYKKGDYATALRIWRSNAELGNRIAQYNMGHLYRNGRGVSKDLEEAFMWYKKSAEQGHIKAQYIIGWMLGRGKGVYEDKEEALKWYKKAAMQGNAKAQHSVGWFYHMGYGAPKDYQEALKWYKKAAGQGHSNSHYNIGRIYSHGIGVPRDYQEALKWYRKAVMLGNASAMNNLGGMYFNGNGVFKDIVRAHMWTTLAKLSGKSKNAERNLRRYERKMTSSQIEEAQSLARNWKRGKKTPRKQYRTRRSPTPSDGQLLPASSGTGFIVSSAGHIVTNYHVIKGCNNVIVYRNSHPYRATIVAADKMNDLALLKTSIRTNHVLSLRSKNPKLLENIYVVGYPFGTSISSNIKVTKGIVSSQTGYANNYSNFQLDAAMQPGNSGGPITDLNGNVIGVSVHKLNLKFVLKRFKTIPENVNFGIKVSSVQNLLDGNNISYYRKNNSTVDLGEKLTDTTFYISCMMTYARIKQMRTQKVLFEDLK